MIRNIGMQNLGFGKMVKFDSVGDNHEPMLIDTKDVRTAEAIRIITERRDGGKMNFDATMIKLRPSGSETNAAQIKVYAGIDEVMKKLDVEG